jgi:hypothetical protein
MPRKNNIDISTLPEALQKDILSQLDKASTAETAKEAIRAKAVMKFYYEVKEEIEAELLKKLMKQPITDANGKTLHFAVSPLAARADGDSGWSGGKILKLIANLPTRKPTTDEGFIKAASNIEKGKKRKVTPEAKAKAEAKKETAAEERLAKAKAKREAKVTEDAAKAKKDEQRGAAGTLFKKKVSNRKTTAKHKSAGAMAVGGDGLTKHQRYEPNRLRSPEQIAEKNEKRRIRRANGNTE